MFGQCTSIDVHGPADPGRHDLTSFLGPGLTCSKVRPFSFGLSSFPLLWFTQARAILTLSRTHSKMHFIVCASLSRKLPQKFVKNLQAVMKDRLSTPDRALPQCQNSIILFPFSPTFRKLLGQFHYFKGTKHETLHHSVRLPQGTSWALTSSCRLTILGSRK